MLDLIERSAVGPPFLVLHPGSKAAIEAAWQDKLLTLPQLEKRLDNRPDLNIGLALGDRTGFIDIEHDGPESADSWHRLTDGVEPDTLSYTSRRGKHYIFRWDDRLAAFDVTTAKLAEYPGLEFRLGCSKGAYSMVPPGTADGITREWGNEHPIIDCPFIDKILAATPESKPIKATLRPDDDIFDQLCHDPAERERAKHYLSFIDPDLPYPDWLAVGMALHSVGMFAEWDEWSRKGAKYEEGDCDRKWGTFTGDGVTLGTLHHYATLGGMPAKPEPAPPEENGDYYRWTRGHDFLRQSDATVYLVKGVLAEHEPMLFGAPNKHLKTSFAVDLAISLLTASPFLGRFKVENVHPAVMLMSAESVGGTLRGMIRRIAESKGLKNDPRLDNLTITPQLPSFSDPKKLAGLTADIKRYGATVCIVDPAYAAMRGASGASLTESGYMLFAISEAVADANATLVLLTHAKKPTRITKSDPALVDIAGAGFGEWARQWFLLKRTEEYKVDGRHSFRCSIGGSAGHQGLYYIDVDEGLVHRGDDEQEPTLWEVTVEPAHQRDQRASQAAAIAKKTERTQAILELIGDGEVTRKDIKDLGIEAKYANPILSELIRGGILTCSNPDDPFKKNTTYKKANQ